MRTAVGTAFVAIALLGFRAMGQPRAVPAGGYREWRVAGGGPESIRYSALSQINRHNVGRLQVAWSYETGDAFAGSEMQCNPIVVDGVLYATSPQLRVIALEAATGRLLWSFLPHDGASEKSVRKSRHRGLTHWRQTGDRRIFVAAGHFLHALEALSGKPIPSFGRDGRVDLREGLGRDPVSISISSNSPVVVYRDLLIVGSTVSESLPSAPGDVRAYEARTGKLAWSFHTIPRPGELGHETWPPEAWRHTGGANNWSGMSLDERRGLVFVPTGSAAFDFYGADRVGDNLFANTLLALRAETGERVWHHQIVRHDLLDRDLPAAPSLVTVRRSGRLVDAVVQLTKTGHAFVFERETGRPMFHIREHAVPASDVEGEVAAATQPLPVRPPPFVRQRFTENLVTRRTPEARRAVLERLGKLRNRGPYEPPSLGGSVVFPGFDGGAEWGGAAVDPETGLLYVNANEMAWVLNLVERGNTKGRPGGRSLYAALCANCHRDDLAGSPPEFPSLLGIGQRRTAAQMTDLIVKGAGRMPGFSFLTGAAASALVRFIDVGADDPLGELPFTLAPPPVKYGITGYNRFLDPDGYPAVRPPWGTLNAINLDTGKIVWKIPLGEFPELAARGLRNTGSENYGGPVVTAGGLVFIAATNHDNKLRAFDKATGRLLWETTLPAAGNATPAVYEVAGRQFVAIAAGGGKSGKTSSGGSYVAFALPEM